MKILIIKRTPFLSRICSSDLTFSNMKTIGIFVLVSLTVGVLSSSLYGEQEMVLREVEQKYSSALDYTQKVITGIDNEMQKEEETFAQQARDEGNTRKEETLQQFNEEVVAATRSAIARGKPLSAIDCIGKLALEGQTLISDVLRKHLKAVDDVKINKHRGLSFAKFEVELVIKALGDLRTESISKIKNATSGFQNLKADALKKVATAQKQLHEIERRVPKPILYEEYTLLKKQIAKIYKDVKDNLFKGLQKCIV